MGIQPQLCPWYLAAVGMEAIVWKSYFFLGFSPSSPLVWEDRLSFSQSVQSLSSVWLFVTPWTEACQAFLPITNCPSSRWCHPTISSSVIPFSSCLQAFPASGPFRVSQFFASGSQSIGVSTSASVLPMNTLCWFPLGWTGWIPCSPRDSQESSPTPQFKNINSSVLSFPHSPILTSIHDYWKNHSFD